MAKRFMCMVLAFSLTIWLIPFTVAAEESGGEVSLLEESSTVYKKGDIVTYGSYPQTLINDETMVQKLNACEGEWVSCKFPDGVGETCYKDVCFEGSKYRAMEIKKFRKYQNRNGYNENTVYWFKYEDLSWKILDPASGLAVSELAIDAYEYNHTSSAVNGYYANNYVYSDIRKWLLEDFMDTAFTEEQKNNLLENAIDNSAPDPTFSSETTNDKVFLLSKGQVESYMSSAWNQAKYTEYACAQGIAIKEGVTQNWMLRTAASPGYSIYYVHNKYGGYIPYYNYDDDVIFASHLGVRPAVYFKDIPTHDDGEEVAYNIQLYSYIPTMIIREGGSIGAAVRLEKNGTVVEEGFQFTIVSSNNDIISIENVRTEKNTTFFDIMGISEGKAVITITDGFSGAVFSTSAHVNSGVYTYNAEAMPKYYDRENECNGYIDGMYIDKFTIKENSGSGMGGRGGSESESGLAVSFKVYNTTSACGSVDVYDAEGNLIRSKLIERFSGKYVTSIKDTLISLCRLVDDVKTGNILTYKQYSYSKETSIDVTVPLGGRIEITNNPTYSHTCAIYNGVDFIVTSILMFGDVANFDGEKIEELSKKTADDLVSGFMNTVGDSLGGNTMERINKLGEKFAQKIGEKGMKKILEDGIKSDLASFIDDGKSILVDCEINLDEFILSSAKDIGVSIAESSLKEAMALPGIVLDGIFTINEFLDYSAFYIDMCTPHSNKALIIYFDDENGCLYDEGVSVKAENGTIQLSQDNYVLHSVVLSNDIDLSEQIIESLDKISDKYIVRNIYLEKDGVISQPNQPVQVTMPIPKGYDERRCKLYWVQDDGSLTEVSNKIENGNFVFVTSHFSYYAVIESGLLGDVNGDGSVNVLDNKVLYNHIEGISVLDGYNLAVADVNGDGSVNVLDNKVLYNHIEGIFPLW